LESGILTDIHFLTFCVAILHYNLDTPPLPAAFQNHFLNSLFIHPCAKWESGNGMVQEDNAAFCLESQQCW